MQVALDQRESLIEAAARRALSAAVDAGEDWTTRLGRPSSNRRARSDWLTHATTVALYRYRYGVTGPTPLGNAKDITKAQQAAEHRAAYAALRRARSLGERAEDTALQRQRPGIEQGRRL